MAEIDAKTLDRIKKCLALAQSSEPHEAALALARAQEMMRAHGVTAEEVEVGPIAEETLRSIASASKLKGWELRLYNAIAEAFGCALLFQRGIRPETIKARGLRDEMRYGKYIFLGPAADAKVAHYAASVLQRQLQRARVRFTLNLSPSMARVEKTREVDAYCLGWVRAATEKVQPLTRSAAREKAIRAKVEEQTGLQKRIEELQERIATLKARIEMLDALGTDEAKKEARGLTVLLKMLEEELERLTGGPAVQHRHGGSMAATLQGMRDGNEAEIHRPMESSATNRPGLPAKQE